ncbi:unnamed protein product [Peniophora sp. CBMAI 1063]|nr:unnamed protein product [Peniophora sp. CBMAI 1063]
MSSDGTTSTVQELRSFVSSVSNLRVFPVILATALFALFTAIMAIALKLQLGRGFGDARARQFLLTATLTMYLMSAIVWSLDLSLLWRELYRLLPGVLPDTSSRPIPAAIQTFDAELLVAHTVCTYINLLLCDIVILWRAYVLYERPRWLLLTSSLFMIIAFVTYIICATLAALTYLPDPSLSITSFLTRTMPGNFELQGLLIANSVSVALTLLANVFALGLITHKVMIHRSAIQNLIVKRPHTQIQTLDILTMIAESNLVYTCFLILYIVMYAGAFGRTAYNYAIFLIAPLSGMYPTLVVLLVSLKKTVLERGFSRMSMSSSAASTAVPSQYRRVGGGLGTWDHELGTNPGSPRSPESTYAGSLSGSTVLGMSPPVKPNRILSFQDVEEKSVL